jgi:uncharacterized protein YciI
VFIATFVNDPAGFDRRTAAKPAHDDYWNSRMDALKFAGPVLGEDGETRLGQVLVIDLADRMAVERLVADDPFVKAGVFLEYNIQRFRISVQSGKPL